MDVIFLTARDLGIDEVMVEGALDLTAMGVARYSMGKHWRRDYHEHFPVSASEDRKTPYELSVTFTCTPATVTDGM